MATQTLTGTQLLPYLSGRIDAFGSATQIRFRQSGTGLRFKATGTDCTLTGTWSGTQPFLLFIDGAQQTTPTHASGVLTLFTGLSDTQRTIELRLNTGYSGTGNYIVPLNNSMVITGAAPAIALDTTWGPQRAVHGGYGILSTILPDTSGTLIGPSLGTTSFPSMSDASGFGAGAAVNSGVRFRARADRIYFYTATTSARWYSLYRDGVRVASVSATASVSLVYQWFEIANSLDDGSAHDWEITTGGLGGGAQSLDMIMIGGASAAFSATSPSPRECILCIGDSLTVAVSGSGSDDTQGNATFAWGAVLGRLLGRDAILAGRSGSPCLTGARQIAADIRMAMAATGRMPTHIVIYYGRNNTDTPTTQTDYTTMLQQALGAPQFTGKIVCVTIPQIGSWASNGALVNTGIRNAVAAVASGRVAIVEGATWTDVGVGSDGTHYTITGQALVGQRLYDSGALTVTGGSYPATANVRLGTQYGPTGSEYTGTLSVPAVGNVLAGFAVDASVGTYVTVGTGSVKLAVPFGPSSSLTGTYDGSDRWTDPGQANVLVGADYKANSATNNRSGTVIQPLVSQVLASTPFGPGGSLTGTLVASGGLTPTNIADIAAAVVGRPEFVAVKAIAYDPTTGSGGRVLLSNGKFVSLQTNGTRLIEDV